MFQAGRGSQNIELDNVLILPHSAAPYRIEISGTTGCPRTVLAIATANAPPHASPTRLCRDVRWRRPFARPACHLPPINTKGTTLSFKIAAQSAASMKTRLPARATNSVGSGQSPSSSTPALPCGPMAAQPHSRKRRLTSRRIGKNGRRGLRSPGSQRCAPANSALIEGAQPSPRRTRACTHTTREVEQPR
jgi:hypothetical protein